MNISLEEANSIRNQIKKIFSDETLRLKTPRMFMFSGKNKAAELDKLVKTIAEAPFGSIDISNAINIINAWQLGVSQTNPNKNSIQVLSTSRNAFSFIKVGKTGVEQLVEATLDSLKKNLR